MATIPEQPDVHLDAAPFNLLVERVVDRLKKGNATRSITLPESKDEFPKLLCLDMNKWIGLAQAHYAHNDGAAFVPALEAITSAVTLGRLVVAISGANALETMEILDPCRKRRLAKFMVGLSGNQCLRHEHAVTIPELAIAIVTVFAGRRWTESARGQLLRRGISHAITGQLIEVGSHSPLLDAILNEALSEPESTVETLVELLDARTTQSFRNDDEDLALHVDRIRRNEQSLPVSARRRMEFDSMLAGAGFRELLQQALSGVGIDERELMAWLETPTNADRFAGAMPGFDVEASLMLTRDRNLDDAPKRNDARDFAFLRVAIPYANVVVTEKSWSHLAAVARLDIRYATKVMHDLRALPEVLTQVGCDL